MHLQTADNTANSANKIKFVFVQGGTVLEFPAQVLERRYYQRAHVKVEIQLSEEWTPTRNVFTALQSRLFMYLRTPLTRYISAY